MLPRGQRIARAQIVDSITDPVGRSEVLATLEFTLAAVADDYAFYTVSLRWPVHIPDANAFGIVVLRDIAATATTAARGKSPDARFHSAAVTPATRPANILRSR